VLLNVTPNIDLLKSLNEMLTFTVFSKPSTNFYFIIDSA